MKDVSAAHGIVPPLLTPFTDDGAIDWAAFERLVEWHVAGGVSGLFVVCGSSEVDWLTEDEAVRIALAAVSRAAGSINILAGSTHYRDWKDREKNVAVTKRMEDAGVDGCFLSPPKDLPEDGRSADEQVLEYMFQLHDAVSCPMFAYERPNAAGRYKFSPEAFAKLGEGRFVGIKDTSALVKEETAEAGLAPIKAKIGAAGESIGIMQAVTKWLLPSWQIGATGACNTTANVAAHLEAKMYLLWEAGDTESAELLQRRIIEIDGMVDYGYVNSAKLALDMLGVKMTPTTRKKSKEFSNEQMETLRDMVALIQKTEDEFDLRGR